MRVNQGKLYNPLQIFKSITEKDINRFKSKLACIDMHQGCHVYTGGTNKNGYGRFWHNGKVVYSHRFAYIVANGDTKLVIHHLCFNRKCCNPEHLRAITVEENAVLLEHRVNYEDAQVDIFEQKEGLE